MNKLIARCLFPSLVLSLGLLCGGAATVNVTISGTTFNPKVVTVTNGDTILWSNGQNSHTVSPRSGVPEAFCGGFSITSCSYTFTNNGSFAYRCNFHEGFNMTGQVIVVSIPTGVPPTVAITNPAHNALFTAPATVAVGISATDSDGTVTNVQLLTNGVVSGTSTTPPFGITLNNLAAGHYTLRARATDSQALSATSAPVNIRVVNRPVLSHERPGAESLRLTYPSVTGVNYVVQGTLDLTNFSPIVTNPGSGTTQTFTQSNPAPAHRFFRLLLQ